MLYDLLKDSFVKNEKLLQRVQELEKQLQVQYDNDGYSSTSSWISKIVFTLQQENRPLRSPELIRLLEKREPTLAQHQNKVQYFPAFLYGAVKRQGYAEKAARNKGLLLSASSLAGCL